MPRTIQGNGYTRRLAAFAPGGSLYDGKPFVVLDADAGVTLQLALNIAFLETVASQQPFIETLREFSRLANTIINICW